MKKRTVVLIAVAAVVVAAGSAVGLAASLGAFSSSNTTVTRTVPPLAVVPRQAGPSFRRGGLTGEFGAATSYLGISMPQIFADFTSGKTLADIAKAEGKSTSGLVDAMVAAQKKSLASDVSAGLITSSREQQLESSVQRRITSVVNNGFSGGRGFGGGFGGGGFGGGPPNHTSTTAQL